MADGHVIIDTQLDSRQIVDSVGKITTVFEGMAGAARLVQGDLTALDDVLRLVSLALQEVINAFTQAIELASDFEQGIAQASTLFRDVAVDVDNLTASMLNLSAETGIAQTDLLEGLYKTLSASIPVTEDMATATEFLGTATKLSIAGMADEIVAVETLAKVINAYNMDVSEANRVASVLIETQNKGITTVGQLGTYFSQAAVSAAEVGVELEQVAASIALLTASGIRARMAATYTRQLIIELDKSGSKGAQTLRNAAVAAGLAETTFREFIDSGWTLSDVVQLISQYTQTMGINMSEAFSSSSALQAAQALADGAERFAVNLELMRNNVDALDVAYTKVTDTLEHKLARIEESQNAVLTAWGLSWMELANTTASAVEVAMQAAADAAAQNDVHDTIKNMVKGWLAEVEGFFLGLGRVIENLPTYIAAAFQVVWEFLGGLIEQIGLFIANTIISTIPNLIINAIASLVDMIVTVLDVEIFGWQPKWYTNFIENMKGVADSIRAVRVPTIQEMRGMNELADAADAAGEALSGLNDEFLTLVSTSGDQTTTINIPWAELSQNLRDYKDTVDSTDEAENTFIANLALLERQQAVWGDRLDLTSNKLSLIKKRITELVEGGATVETSPALSKLLDMYDELANVDTTVQDVQQVYDTFNETIQRNIDYYGALGDTTGLYNAQISATQNALVDLLRLGVQPTDAGFKLLVGKLNNFNTSLENMAADSKGQEIFNTLNEQLAYADNYLEVYGDEEAATAIKTRALTIAIEDLMKLNYSKYSGDIANLRAQLLELTPTTDEAAEVLGGLDSELSLIDNKVQVFGASTTLTQEAINAYKNAIISLLKLGLEPTNDTIQLLAANLVILEASLNTNTTKAKTALEVYDDALKNISIQQDIWGSSYDAVTAQIRAIETAIQGLISEGINPEDAAIQHLINQWEKLTTKQKAARMVMQAAQAGVSSLVSGLEDSFQALYEGEDAWGAFAKAGLTAIAAVLESLAQQMAVQAIAAYPNFPMMAALGAGSVAAIALAALVRSYAGTFATGGIVQGPYNGKDNLIASVKAGEVILNHAQAINTAKLLEAADRSRGGGTIAVNFNGVVLGTKKEISKYVYDGIKEAQCQGALKKW